MNQIVTELRARASARHSGPEPSLTAQLCAQAADRIEALEVALATIAGPLDYDPDFLSDDDPRRNIPRWSAGQCRSIARDALTRAAG